MGRVKEKWINNLTDDEIDELYVELMNAEHYIYIEKEDEILEYLNKFEEEESWHGKK